MNPLLFVVVADLRQRVAVEDAFRYFAIISVSAGIGETQTDLQLIVAPAGNTRSRV